MSFREEFTGTELFKEFRVLELEARRCRHKCFSLLFGVQGVWSVLIPNECVQEFRT
jgi:hypothetical protein